MSESSAQIEGKVYLVGAGPGDPELITVRGRQCLERADVVLYDYLANPEVLEYARPAAEAMCLGRHGRSRIWTQDEVNAAMIEHARAGRQIVRLKGGDPLVFARAGAEMQALDEAGIPFELVPGVTAATAAAAYTGVPITDRHAASAVAFLTGQELQSKDPHERIDFSALARFPGTLAVYMGVTTAGCWSRQLIEAGKDAQTPVVIVRRCSLPDQLSIRCTLAEVAEQLHADRNIRPPVVVLIGPATAVSPAWNWYERRPLFGRTVLVTRPRHQASEMARLLSDQGAQVLLQPAIDIRPPDDWADVDAALDRMATFDWLVFSSANGVRYLLDRLLARGQDLRRLGDVRLAVIGPGTAAALAEYHLCADVQPERFQAEDLAGALAGDAADKHFLLARASRGREVLAEQLQAAGGRVTQVVIYQSRDVATADELVQAAWDQDRVHWVTVTSSAIAHSLWALFGTRLSAVRLASISPLTSDALRQHGLEPAAEARQATMRALVEAIAAYELTRDAAQ